MPLRGLPARLLAGFGILCLGVLAVLGGLGLEPGGRVAVGVAGLLAAAIAVGVTRDLPRTDRRPATESAVQAAAWTVGGLLLLAGVAALVGGVVAVLVGAATVGTWLVVRATRPAGSSPSPPSTARTPRQRMPSQATSRARSPRRGTVGLQVNAGSGPLPYPRPRAVAHEPRRSSLRPTGRGRSGGRGTPRRPEVHRDDLDPHHARPTG